MVWKAHVPHKESNRDTWFGYWKDDGFVKTKHKGRVDINHGWPALRDKWVDMFRNRRVQPGISVLKKVGDENEWCAEAYMETDYAKLSEIDFRQTVQKYLMFQLVNEAEEKARLGVAVAGADEDE